MIITKCLSILQTKIEDIIKPIYPIGKHKYQHKKNVLVLMSVLINQSLVIIYCCLMVHKEYLIKYIDVYGELYQLETENSSYDNFNLKPALDI